MSFAEQSPTTEETAAWKVVCDSALARVRGSKGAGSMIRLAEDISGEHRFHALKGEELRRKDTKFEVPPSIQLFLTRFFTGLMRKYSILEVDKMMIGDNVLPISIPIQGCLVPCAVTGKDEQGSDVHVQGAALILFSSIAVMPAQLSSLENISEVIVNFLPNGTAICSFYDPKVDILVIAISR